MQNPNRVPPPLMSEESAPVLSEDRAPMRQPTFSAFREPSEGQAVASDQARQEPSVKIESSVSMPPIKKNTENHEARAEDAAKASSDAQAGASNHKTKKAPNAFRTISEVASELDVQQHVLRFWETKFTQVKPLKRGGGRRYYRPEDVAILKRIHHLLYTEGYTIKGVQKLLKGRGKSQVAAAEAQNQNAARDVAPAPQPKVQTTPPAAQATPQSVGMSAKQRAVLEMMLAELKSLRSMIKA